MSPKIKNILIFTSIGLLLFLTYTYFIKGNNDSTVQGLTTSAPVTPITPASGVGAVASPAVAGDFLSLLLSVKSIKLNVSIFSDPAFQSLQDSSILLVPDGTEGRLNPFAPFEQDQATSVDTAITDSTSPVINTTDTNSLKVIPPGLKSGVNISSSPNKTPITPKKN